MGTKTIVRLGFLYGNRSGLTNRGYRSGGTRRDLGTVNRCFTTDYCGSISNYKGMSDRNNGAQKREHGSKLRCIGTVHSESCIYIPSTR